MLLGEWRDLWRAEPRDHRTAFVVIAVVGVVLRLLTLSQPMRYDEAVTWLEFVRLPLTRALSSYQYPNNHLFHTLLAKGAVALFGNSPWVLRLPAFLAGLAVVPMSYAMTRMLFGARPALVAMALVASSGMLALYSTNARGYTLVTLACLALVVIAARLLLSPSRRLWVAYGVVSAFGVWTIPVMLYPLGAVSLWLALNLLVEGRRRELTTLAVALAVGTVLALVAYTPVFLHSGVAAVVQNKFIQSSEWTQFLKDMGASGWSTIRSWGLGLPPLVSAVFLALLVIGLDRQNRYSKFRVGLPLAAFVWSAWLLVVTHRAPFARIWLWTIPIAAAIAGAGLIDALDRTRELARVAVRIPWVAGFIAIGAALSVALSDAVIRSHDTGTFVDAEATALQLSRLLQPGDRVIALIPTNAPLAYYLDRLGMDPEYMRLEEGQAKRLIVVVNEGERETLDANIEGIATTDSSQFITTKIAEYPLSKTYLFDRRRASK